MLAASTRATLLPNAPTKSVSLIAPKPKPAGWLPTTPITNSFKSLIKVIALLYFVNSSITDCSSGLPKTKLKSLSLSDMK